MDANYSSHFDWMPEYQQIIAMSLCPNIIGTVWETYKVKLWSDYKNINLQECTVLTWSKIESDFRYIELMWVLPPLIVLWWIISLNFLPYKMKKWNIPWRNGMFWKSWNAVTSHFMHESQTASLSWSCCLSRNQLKSLQAAKHFNWYQDPTIWYR